MNAKAAEGKPSAPTEKQVSPGSQTLPSAAEAERFLRQRIEEQSERRIKLVGFRQSVARPGDVEVEGRKTFTIGFQADLEIASPCQWASRFEGRPMTFKILKPDQAKSLGQDSEVMESSEANERFSVFGYVLFTPAGNGWSASGFGQVAHAARSFDSLSRRCAANLKQIGMAFHYWAQDNDDRFPFNISTNKGGSREFSARAIHGFDSNAALHFQVMSNELIQTAILVCPADNSKQPASAFSTLGSNNVTYLLRSGTNIDEMFPEEILTFCPIHFYSGYCDGSVNKAGKK